MENRVPFRATLSPVQIILATITVAVALMGQVWYISQTIGELKAQVRREEERLVKLEDRGSPVSMQIKTLVDSNARQIDALASTLTNTVHSITTNDAKQSEQLLSVVSRLSDISRILEEHERNGLKEEHRLSSIESSIVSLTQQQHELRQAVVNHLGQTDGSRGSLPP